MKKVQFKQAVGFFTPFITTNRFIASITAETEKVAAANFVQQHGLQTILEKELYIEAEARKVASWLCRDFEVEVEDGFLETTDCPTVWYTLHMIDGLICSKLSAVVEETAKRDRERDKKDFVENFENDFQMLGEEALLPAHLEELYSDTSSNVESLQQVYDGLTSYCKSRKNNNN